MRIDISRVMVPVMVAILLASPLAGQGRIAGPQPGVAVPVRATAPAELAPRHHTNALRRASGGRMVLGGVIGAATGVLACKLRSDVVWESMAARGRTARGDLMFGVGCAVIGLLVAVLTD